MPNQILRIDGKNVRSFLFCRASRLDKRPVLAQVQGFSKDDAIIRLTAYEPFIDPRDWEFIEELDPEHDVGSLGKKYPIRLIGAS